MRPFVPGVGRQLGSVAMRYRNPCAVGEWHDRLLGGGKGVRNRPGFGIPSYRRGAGSPENHLARLEALLFLSRQPQTSRRLAELTGLADGTKARTLVRTLNRRYDAEGSAFRIEEVAGGFQLMTRSKFAPWLRRLQAAPAEIRLSAPAMETLAVVAYRQPVLRVEIEAIRGVQSGEVLRQLIERDLVRIAGRSDELGRPFLYGTTKQFLQIFGLRHLDELPHSSNQTPVPVAEEEENVKTLITAKTLPSVAQRRSGPANPRHAPRVAGPVAVGKPDEEEEEEEDLDEEEEDDEDYDEEDFKDEDADEEEDEDEELEDEWEEVEDDDEELDEDEDEDEDWDDEDWDEDEDEDEDEDWDEDEDEDWDEDEEEEDKKE
jgi:segregation and condensation protein B